VDYVGSDELGKRPKLEYQISGVFTRRCWQHYREQPDTAWLLLRRKEAYAVNLGNGASDAAHS